MTTGDIMAISNILSAAESWCRVYDVGRGLNIPCELDIDIKLVYNDICSIRITSTH